MLCDLCKIEEATKDSKTIYGCWAFVCDNCFARVGIDVPGMYKPLKNIKSMELEEKDFKEIFNEILEMQV